MSVDPNSHDASMTRRDVTVERDGHMARSSITFDADAGTRIGIAGRKGAGESTLFNAIDGLLPVHQGESNAQ